MASAQRDFFGEIYDAFLGVEMRRGRAPKEIVVLPAALWEDRNQQTADESLHALVHVDWWRRTVREHLHQMWGTRPQGWEVERYMRMEARFMGVPVNVAHLPRLY